MEFSDGTYLACRTERGDQNRSPGCPPMAGRGRSVRAARTLSAMLALTFPGALAGQVAGEWRIETETDPMTDAREASVRHLRADEESGWQYGAVSYSCSSATNDGEQSALDNVYLVFGRADSVEVRFDSKPMERHGIVVDAGFGATEDRSLHRVFVDNLLTSEIVLVRALGRLYRFSLEGFAPLYRRAREWCGLEDGDVGLRRG